MPSLKHKCVFLVAKYKWTWIFELVWDIAFHWIPISSKSLNQVLFYIYLELLVHPSETPYEVCNSLKIIWISALKHHCALIFGAASDLLPNSLRYSSSLHLRDPISLTALSPVRRSQQATILMIVVWNQSLEKTPETSESTATCYCICYGALHLLYWRSGKVFSLN